ncbi:MAG: hypothetical protein Q4E34_00330 [Synergistaceae bacterium]|nr:hypothetical protein [Synergistaceae bacterium]
MKIVEVHTTQFFTLRKKFISGFDENNYSICTTTRESMAKHFEKEAATIIVSLLNELAKAKHTENITYRMEY